MAVGKAIVVSLGAFSALFVLAVGILGSGGAMSTCDVLITIAMIGIGLTGIALIIAARVTRNQTVEKTYIFAGAGFMLMLALGAMQFGKKCGLGLGKCGLDWGTVLIAAIPIYATWQAISTLVGVSISGEKSETPNQAL